MKEQKIQAALQDWFNKRRKLNIDLENANTDISYYYDEINGKEYYFSQNKNKFLGINIYKIITILLVIGGFLIYKSNPNFKVNKESVVSKNYILFEEPDNESNIILKGENFDDLKILSSTKYYHKVELTANNKKTIGYINKKFFNGK